MNPITPNHTQKSSTQYVKRPIHSKACFNMTKWIDPLTTFWPILGSWFTKTSTSLKGRMIELLPESTAIECISPQMAQQRKSFTDSLHF